MLLINFLEKLFPLNRSITGEGLRQTLQIIKNEIGQLDIHNIPSGTKVFDWVVPDEWHCKDAYILQGRIVKTIANTYVIICK